MQRLLAGGLARWSLRQLADYAGGDGQLAQAFVRGQTRLHLARQWTVLARLADEQPALGPALAELRALLERWALDDADWRPGSDDNDAAAEQLRLISQQVEAATFRCLRAVRLLAAGAPQLSVAVSPSLDRLLQLQLSAATLVQHFVASHAAATAERDRLAQRLQLDDDVLQPAVEYARGFCVEKNGVCPDVRHLAAPQPLVVVGVPALLRYIVVELLKNAMQATIAASNFDIDRIEASAIDVRAAVDPAATAAGVRVSDQAGGVDRYRLPHQRRRSHARPDVFHYFYTTVEPLPETYTYGGAFGAPFSGEGVGLPLSRLYARFHGGDIQINTLPGHGTDVHLYLDPRGTHSIHHD